VRRVVVPDVALAIFAGNVAPETPHAEAVCLAAVQGNVQPAEFDLPHAQARAEIVVGDLAVLRGFGHLDVRILVSVAGLVESARDDGREILGRASEVKAHVLESVADTIGVMRLCAGHGPGSDGVDDPALAGRTDFEIVAEKAFVVPAPAYVAANGPGGVIEVDLREPAIHHELGLRK